MVRQGRPQAHHLERAGWAAVTAVARRHVFEVKSTYILQPGPAALTEGVRQLHALLARTLDLDVHAAIAPEKPIDGDASTGLAGFG